MLRVMPEGGAVLLFSRISELPTRPAIVESEHSDEPYLVIFTELDGVLLDAETGSWQAAEETVQALRDAAIPLVFCSRKTRAELLAVQSEMQLDAPIVAENGSAMFFPPDYFRDPVPGARPAGSTYGSGAELDVVELGIPVERVRELLDEIRRQTRLSFRHYGEMSIEEIAEETGIDTDTAARAGEREFSERVRVDLNPEQWDDFFLALAERGLACSIGDRFSSVFSALTDKGRGVRLVSELLRREVAPLETIGIGSDNDDVYLLDAVDRPFIVQRPDETWAKLDVEGLQKVQGVGPRGWSRLIQEIVLN